ncbi:clavesin-1-like [Leptidea sinapis]|uniref:clavesin-1-like n=1 Tax=Leptidea sinapis TaxID=189913 RepID=UPI00212AE8E2|nr:clavesin-1-like [Leptidea sinapis]XP_050668073.1 clavesin-1-like [Leptidea sinapis]
MTMYDCFLEIAFEAELDTKEDPELLEISSRICNENLSTRATAITELRKMIFDRGECEPRRTDDEYLLRFLRCKDFIVPRAHRLLVRYCRFREDHPHLYQDVDLWSLMKVGNIYECCLHDKPGVGRLSIVRLGKYDTTEIAVEDLLRTALVVMEIGLRQPKNQVLGGTIIVDLEGLSLKQISTLTPSIAYQIVSILGGATPARLNSLHLINYTWLLNTFFYIFKKFIPQNAWDRIHFHGSDLKSLHKIVDLECLPARYGGTCNSVVSVSKWLQKIKKYRDGNFDREMKELGYLIKE